MQHNSMSVCSSDVELLPIPDSEMLPEDASASQAKSDPFIHAHQSLGKHSRLEQTSRAAFKLQFFSGLVILFCIGELCVGTLTHSLVLLTDAIHMFSDVGTLYVALYAISASSIQPDFKFHYGRRRAEYVGALINLSFLVAMCLFIVLEAVERFLEPEKIVDPELIIVMGGCGFLLNSVGVFFFHSHSSHGHSHGGTSVREQHHHVTSNATTSVAVKSCYASNFPSRAECGHSHSLGTNFANNNTGLDRRANSLAGEESTSEVSEKPDIPLLSGGSLNGNSADSELLCIDGDRNVEEDCSNRNAASHGHSHSFYNANIHAIFLHVLTDLLSSIVVIVSGLIQYLDVNQTVKEYFDSVASILIALGILFSSLPLFRDCIYVLMQGSPLVDESRTDYTTRSLIAQLERIRYVDTVERISIWTLSSEILVASVHVKLICLSGSAEATPTLIYKHVSSSVENILASYGITETTIQIHFP